MPLGRGLKHLLTWVMLRAFALSWQAQLLPLQDSEYILSRSHLLRLLPARVFCVLAGVAASGVFSSGDGLRSAVVEDLSSPVLCRAAGLFS